MGAQTARGSVTARKKISPVERWATYVNRVSTAQGCWLWTGATDRNGYGQISVAAGRPGSAHRVAWWVASGAPPPADLWVLHTCDTPLCQRNDDEGTYEVAGVLLPRRGHLFLGTNTDNIADMHAKGRHPHGATWWTERRTAEVARRGKR